MENRKKKNFWGMSVLVVLCAFVVYTVFSQVDFSKFSQVDGFIFTAPPITEINMGQFPDPECHKDHGFGVCLGSIIMPADFHSDRDYSFSVAEVEGRGRNLSQVVRLQYATTNERGQPIAKALIWTFSGENAKFPLTVQLRDGDGRFIAEAGLGVHD